jgi:hypothetical protein
MCQTFSMHHDFGVGIDVPNKRFGGAPPPSGSSAPGDVPTLGSANLGILRAETEPEYTPFSFADDGKLTGDLSGVVPANGRILEDVSSLFGVE